MANLLVNTLSRYCYWYGRTTPEYQEVPPATPPPDIHPGRLHPAWVEGRINIMNHNNAGKAKTANVIGKMVAQLVNELKPDNIPHPQINYYFLKQWYVFKIVVYTYIIIKVLGQRHAIWKMVQQNEGLLWYWSLHYPVWPIWEPILQNFCSTYCAIWLHMCVWLVKVHTIKCGWSDQTGMQASLDLQEAEIWK